MGLEAACRGGDGDARGDPALGIEDRGADAAEALGVLLAVHRVAAPADPGELQLDGRGARDRGAREGREVPLLAQPLGAGAGGGDEGLGDGERVGRRERDALGEVRDAGEALVAASVDDHRRVVVLPAGQVGALAGAPVELGDRVGEPLGQLVARQVVTGSGVAPRLAPRRGLVQADGAGLLVPHRVALLAEGVEQVPRRRGALAELRGQRLRRDPLGRGTEDPEGGQRLGGGLEGAAPTDAAGVARFRHGCSLPSSVDLAPTGRSLAVLRWPLNAVADLVVNITVMACSICNRR